MLHPYLKIAFIVKLNIKSMKMVYNSWYPSRDLTTKMWTRCWLPILESGSTFLPYLSWKMTSVLWERRRECWPSRIRWPRSGKRWRGSAPQSALRLRSRSIGTVQYLNPGFQIRQSMKICFLVLLPSFDRILSKYNYWILLVLLEAFSVGSVSKRSGSAG